MIVRLLDKSQWIGIENIDIIKDEQEDDDI